MKNSGVLMLFFDLPAKTPAERKAYRRFIKYIKGEGFIMLQESVYVKLQRTVYSTGYDTEELKKHSPREGNIMLLPLTVNNFSKLIAIRGEIFNVPFLCDDFIVI